MLGGRMNKARDASLQIDPWHTPGQLGHLILPETSRPPVFDQQLFSVPLDGGKIAANG